MKYKRLIGDKESDGKVYLHQMHPEVSGWVYDDVCQVKNMDYYSLFSWSPELYYYTKKTLHAYRNGKDVQPYLKKLHKVIQNIESDH